MTENGMDDPELHRADPFGPVAQEVRDRRLIMRFYDVWAAAADDRPYPALTDFSSPELAPFKPFSVLIDLQDGYDAPVLRVVGREIAARMDDDYCGRAPTDTPRQSVLSRVTDHYLEVLANRAPVAVEAEFRDSDGSEVPYRAVLAPLSRNGETIDFILGVVNWKGAAAAEPWATAQNLAPDLVADLAALHAQVAAAGRSRQALYALLADIFSFWRAAEANQDAYATILGDHGLKAQKRAPFTALLKLVFGRHYDKTRLTEYAAALAHAQRQGWPPAVFLERLMEDGGMKAMVRTERRRRGAGKPDAEEGLSQRTAALPAIAKVQDWPFGNAGDDVLVLLARRDGEGGLAIVAADPATGPEGARIVRNLVRRQLEKNK